MNSSNVYHSLDIIPPARFQYHYLQDNIITLERNLFHDFQAVMQRRRSRINQRLQQKAVTNHAK